MTPRKREKVRMHLVEEAAARRIVYLEKAEVERFFDAIPRENTRDRLLFDIIYRHGCVARKLFVSVEIFT